MVKRQRILRGNKEIPSKDRKHRAVLPFCQPGQYKSGNVDAENDNFSSVGEFQVSRAVNVGSFYEMQAVTWEKVEEAFVYR